MFPVNEVSVVISDPQMAKLAQPVKEQASKDPPPKGSRFNPIYVEPGSTSIESTRDLQYYSPTALTALVTCQKNMTSKQTWQSYQFNTEDAKSQ